MSTAEAIDFKRIELADLAPQEASAARRLPAAAAARRGFRPRGLLWAVWRSTWRACGVNFASQA